MNVEWMADAACAESAVDYWFPGTGENKVMNVGVGYCERCPVRRACLDYAIANGITEGIWGGLSPAGRRKLGRSIAA